MALGVSRSANASQQRSLHSPAYVAQIGSWWRVVVPVRGRLSPDVTGPKFLTRATAQSWLEHRHGQQAVDKVRSGG